MSWLQMGMKLVNSLCWGLSIILSHFIFTLAVEWLFVYFINEENEVRDV